MRGRRTDVVDIVPLAIPTVHESNRHCIFSSSPFTCTNVVAGLAWVPVSVVCAREARSVCPDKAKILTIATRLESTSALPTARHFLVVGKPDPARVREATMVRLLPCMRELQLLSQSF